jgi:hypothetical protein
LGNLTDFKINIISFIELLITLKYIGIYIKKGKKGGVWVIGKGDRLT